MHLSVDGTNDFYLVGMGEACFSRDIGQYRALLFDCRGDHRSSEVVSVTAAHSSVAQKRDLQKPSLVREGGRQTELAECRLTDE